MALKTLDEHIESTPNILGGKPRIAGHRIAVESVVTWHEHMGQSVEQIAADYNLSIADVYAALAYYHDHRETIDKTIQTNETFADEVKTKIPSKVKK